MGKWHSLFASIYGAVFIKKQSFNIVVVEQKRERQRGETSGESAGDKNTDCQKRKKGDCGVCTDGKDGYVNKYELSMDDLKVLRLSDSQYNILHWLALLVTYRKLRLATPMMKKSVEWLKENFLLDITQFDIIVGYRADNSRLR